MNYKHKICGAVVSEVELQKVKQDLREPFVESNDEETYTVYGDGVHLFPLVPGDESINLETLSAYENKAEKPEAEKAKSKKKKK